jgi:hypothetical protein
VAASEGGLIEQASREDSASSSLPAAINELIFRTTGFCFLECAVFMVA